MKIFRVIFFYTVILKSLSLAVIFPQTSITIQGNVIDGETGIPIKDAAIFLSFSTFHTKTNILGEYELSAVVPGTYAIVCIADSFQRITQQIDVTGKVNLRANFVLKKTIPPIKKVIGLETLIEKDKFVEKFKKEFLGEGVRTGKCDIINPEDIEFTHNGIQLFAKSSKPIIVLNKSLGYKISLYINEFGWEWFKDYGSFSFDMYFDEMVPEDSTEALKYFANRKEAYLGSFRHFLRSCAARRVYSEGFRVFSTYFVPDELGDYEDFQMQVVKNRAGDTSRIIEFILQKITETDFAFETDSYLEVVYVENSEDPNYSSYKERIFGSGELYKFQDSWIKFPAGKYFFNSKGIGLENETYQKQLFGYWAWKRVADFLPSNYELSNSQE